MAVVYQVLDTSSKRQLALKTLLSDAHERPKEVARLFEYEYQTLAQLAHPGVVEVYDYGIENEAAYYTMELLDGGDLDELSPMPWPDVCAHGYDICSVLSLLHSRRLVHRDITPRNVRCTADGRAKLIDFGAMMPMGPCRQIVGTAPYIAPEVLNMQRLDARTDLYSLGATLYYALTKRHVYRAKNLKELPDLWRNQPQPPSDFIEGIPEAMDRLVMSLVKLDPIARPVNASEVMERLSAIAGLKREERFFVSEAYLSTPTLVGREEELLRVRKYVVRALRKRGGALTVEGVSGVGRSRFLDACVLEGKIAGLTVLRAEASDAWSGEYGTVRNLAFQLLETLPEVASSTVEPYLPVLGHVLPELLDRFHIARRTSSNPPPDGVWVRTPSEPPFAPDRASPRANYQPDRASDKDTASDGDFSWIDPRVRIWNRTGTWMSVANRGDYEISLSPVDDRRELRLRVQMSLRDWLLKVSENNAIMIGIDDLHRIDEPSASFVAFLAHNLQMHRLLIAVTFETDAPATSEGALKLLIKDSSNIKLKNLDLHNTERLIDSIFGKVPNIKLLADRLQSHAKGNPRAMMRYAQYLIDTSAIHFQTGTWILPSRLDDLKLPESLADTFSVRIKKLSHEARRLARTLALIPDYSFTADEIRVLTASEGTVQLIPTLDELVAREVLSTDGSHYSFSQDLWASAFTDSLSDTDKRSSHLRIAGLLESRPNEGFRVTRHLLYAGEETKALDKLVEVTKQAYENIQQDDLEVNRFIRKLPVDWRKTFKTLRAIGQRLGRPRSEDIWLQNALVAYSVLQDASDKDLLVDLIDKLYHASGLSIYYEMDDSIEPSERLSRALELVQLLYDSTPDSDRTFAPADAIRWLGTALVMAIKLAGTSFDYSLIASVPSLGPFIPLAPAIDLVERNIKSTAHLTAGRNEAALRGYRDILDMLDQPERGGMLDDVVFKYVRYSIVYAIGMLEASYGFESVLKRTDELEQDPAFQVNALIIRMLYFLYQGDTVKAEQIREQMELLRIRNSPTQFFEGTFRFSEVGYYSIADDLNGIKQSLNDIEKMAGTFGTWLPVLFFTKGELQRLRGDYTSALSEYQEALNIMLPGEHLVWAQTAAGYIKTLCELKRFPEAVQVGRQWLKQAERAELGVYTNCIRNTLAVAEAAIGEFEVAKARVQAAIDSTAAFVASMGVYPGACFETRARIAIFMRDEEGFWENAQLCAQHYRIGYNPALTVKYEKLLGQARQAGLGMRDTLDTGGEPLVMGKSYYYDVVTGLMSDCHDAKERSQGALRLLVEYSKSAGGYLYVMRPPGPVLSAKSADLEVPADLDATVAQFLSAELESTEQVTTIVDSVTMADLDERETNVAPALQNRWRHPLILGHKAANGFLITGLAILVIDPSEETPIPSDLTVCISRYLLESGDATAVMAAS